MEELNLSEMKNESPKSGVDNSRVNKLIFFGVIVTSVLAIIAFIVVFAPKRFLNLTPDPFSSITKSGRLSKFTGGEQEVKLYLQSLANQTGSFVARELATDLAAPVSSMEKANTAGGGQADRVSQTNVQVKGIDEPDIVKTDGKNIYFSGESNVFYPLIERDATSTGAGVSTSLIAPDSKLIYPPIPVDPGTTRVIGAYPPEALSLLSKIDSRGELLLSENNLLVFSYDKIKGYDVSDPKNPKEIWSNSLESNEILSSRLYKGKIYLVTRKYLNYGVPCPVPFMKEGQREITIACNDIYHPESTVSVDSTYTVSIIDPKNGSAIVLSTFLGSTGSSVVFVSESAIYISYSYQGDFVGLFYNFVSSDAADIIPNGIKDKINNLRKYDISNQSKLNEIQIILQTYFGSLSNDERLKAENELSNKLGDFIQKHSRELEISGIVKLPFENPSHFTVGAVPGQILNQFSMDEYNNNLRVATTITPNFYFGFGINPQTESVNDLYVLDESLHIIGSLTDMAKGERVFSARFMGERGYVVTFKQIDPFFVFDLSDPKNPKKAGELKIPGYSSYLHPLTHDRILGVGQENGQVKLSIFNVSNAQSPTEESKYSMNEYWTEVSNNHHAFLQDEKYKIFFLPSGNAGYIFSYENGLTLKRAVSSTSAKRAIYLNDYLYIISEEGIKVISEKDMSQVSQISF